jgi:putative CocE/NonD family hydrolase
MRLAEREYDRIDIPILTITGHYDDDQPGAMHYYHQHMRSNSPARQQHYLIIGPWDHLGTRTPNQEFGGLKFGEACMLDLNQLHTEWYAWTLQGGPKPEFLKKRVAYYLTGADEWKYADSLDAISDVTRRLYLSSPDGGANDVFHSGVLEPTPPTADETPDNYTYDPLDVRPAELEQEELKYYLTDQRYALNLFGNGLVYHSEPFEEDTEIIGIAGSLDRPGCAGYGFPGDGQRNPARWIAYQADTGCAAGALSKFTERRTIGDFRRDRSLRIR